MKKIFTLRNFLFFFFAIFGYILGVIQSIRWVSLMSDRDKDIHMTSYNFLIERVRKIDNKEERSRNE